MMLQYASNQLSRPCELPFAGLLPSVEDDLGESLARNVWSLLEDLGGRQWEGEG